jgi:hypothetical protein
MTKSPESDKLLWIERALIKSPFVTFLFAYLLFIAIFSIYMYFDTKTTFLDLTKFKHLLPALFSSFIIPFELIAIEILSNGSRTEFRKLDTFFRRSQSNFYSLLREKIIDQKFNYFLLFLLIGLPLILLGWSFDFFDAKNFTWYDGKNYLWYDNNTWSGSLFALLGFEHELDYLAIDILNNLLLIISILLFCIILWIFIIIYWSFHLSCEKMTSDLSKYNIIIMQRKVIFVRNFFLLMLLTFTITISSLYLSAMNTDYTIFNNYFLLVLFILGMVSTTIALRDAYSIVERAADQKMEHIDGAIENARAKMESFERIESDEGKRELEKLQKSIDIHQTEWDRVIQQRVGFSLKENIKEVLVFVLGTIIPIITFLISNKILK